MTVHNWVDDGTRSIHESRDFVSSSGQEPESLQCWVYPLYVFYVSRKSCISRPLPVSFPKPTVKSFLKNFSRNSPFGVCDLWG